ncbi:MAG: PadR family transcriptional regulator, partial [Firmicutes bacterium]|nr:PadR family transcriptional regulator [Bacillota bacterium]
LVEQGLATKRADSESGRNKLIYTITDAGREYLKHWLALPVEKDELRYETLLKVFFGNEAGQSQALSHIENFHQKIENELPYLLKSAEILSKIADEDATHKYYLLTVEFGIKTYQAYLEWCEQAEKILSKESEAKK